MKTVVVNLNRGEPYDVYIGRGSPFGNPFKGAARDACIALYQNHFEQLILTDPKFKAAVERLRGQRLGCFCKPLDCHGDVIVKYLEGTP